MEVFLFLLVFLVIFGIAIAASVAQAKKIRENWGMFARAHGLVFTPGGGFRGGTMQGQFQGFAVNIYTETRGSGKSKSTYTLFTVAAGVPLDLNLYQEGALSFLTKALGVQDIQTGNAQLDARFIIQGSDAQGIRYLLLHPRVRDALLGVGAAQSGLRINGGHAIIEMRGVPTEIAVLQGCLSGAIAVASALHEAMGVPVAVAPVAARTPPHISNRATAAPVELFAALGAIGAVSSPPPRTLAASNRRTASPPPPRPVDVSPPVRPAPPVAAAPEPVLALEDAIKRLSSPGITSDEREKLIAAVKGKRCEFSAIVERVDWTSDLSLPDDFRSGRTVICKFAGATIAARYPSGCNAELDALSRGAALDVRGVVSGWDDFYGQLTVVAT